MGAFSRTRAVASLVLLFGCEAFDPELLERRTASPIGGEPTPVRDAGGDDAALCSLDPDAPAFERCNGQDDDCDGRLDEGAEDDCRFEHAVGACVPGGLCVIAECSTGYADCNGTRDDGCEAERAKVACGTCGRVCPGKGDAGRPEPGPDEDAGMMEPVDAGEPPPECMPEPEICNQADDDCDEWVDESGACALEECIASTPSYRGSTCDGCVCERCTVSVEQCQNHPDPTWAERCRALVECVVVHDSAGECGPFGDCYIANTGPCAAEVNIASGGSGPDDPTRAASGCAAGSPPSTPCAAAINYRDECSQNSCARSCD